MRAARLVFVLLLAYGSSLAAKLPGHEAHYNNNNNNQGQSSANSGSGGSGGDYWWMNNDVFGGGGGNRPTNQASGNANAQASASSGGGGHQGGGSHQTGALQNIAQPPQINVQQQNFNPNVFTPTQSPHCARGQDCVRWQLCKNGVVSLTGKSIPRQKPVPNNMNAKSCGMLGNICCSIPASVLATQQQLGHHNQVQTSNLQQPQQQQQQQQQQLQQQQQPQQQQGGSGYQTSTNQNQQSLPSPSQQQFQSQPSFPQAININNIQPEVPRGPPFPECSASLFCIHQSECNLYNGFIEPQIETWPGQPFVQISMCTSDTLLEGVCCQEPHPEFDIWTERPGLDQQSSGSSQQQNFQQQAVGSKPQQFGNNKPQGNQGHSIASNRPQTNFQQPNQPLIQQPSQAISFPQQNQPLPQQPSQVGYQQPAQSNFQQPSQNQFQQPAQNNFQQQSQTNNQQPAQGNFQQPAQGNFQQPAQSNFQQPSQNQFQQPAQSNFQQQPQNQFQQPNRPIIPSHNDNNMPNLNLVGLANSPSSSQGVGPNEQFPSIGPHPTCSSGLLCVERSQCNLYNGFIEEQIQTHADQQFVAINLCTMQPLRDGVCCQEKRTPGALAPGALDDGQYRGPGALDDGQYKGPGALNSGQQQTFVQQGARPQQGFTQQASQPQQSFVAQNTVPQQGFSQQAQQTVGSPQHSGVQHNKPVQQQQQQQPGGGGGAGGYDWQNADAFQPQVPSSPSYG